MGDHQIKIVQINTHHATNAATNLKHKLDTIPMYVACLQEPYITVSGKVGCAPRHGNVYTFGQGRSRAAILASKNISTWPLPHFSNEDIVSVSTNNALNGETIIIASAYLDIKNKTLSQELTSLIRHCQVCDIALILCIDANAHNTFGVVLTPTDEVRCSKNLS